MATHVNPHDYPETGIPNWNRGLCLHQSADSNNPSPSQVPLDAKAKGHLITEHEIKNPDLSDDSYILINADKPYEMDCFTCKKLSEKEDGLICVACTRNAINPLRIELTKVLLQKEELAKKVEHIIDPDNNPAPDEDTKRLAVLLRERHLRKIEAEQEQAEEERVRELLAIKQQELADLKARRDNLKSHNSQRKNDLAKTKKEILGAKKQQLKEMAEKAAQEKLKAEALHNKTIEAKATLCREVASLKRLRHGKKKLKDGTIKELYFVSGLVLPDLRQINNMRCTELTAVLGNTAFVLHLCTYYIGVKLPSEITVPHRDYPLTTIMTPAQSYLGQNIPFPGSGSALGSVPASPSATRSDPASLPRPRPLFIGSDDYTESVAQFAKKDPVAFSFFLEGIALLAYNVAWFSRSQGFLQGTDSWEDICDMGRILHEMLVAPPQSPAVMRVMSQRDLQERRSRNSSSSAGQEPGNNATGRLGAGSHTSMHDFYTRSELSKATRNWRFNNYKMIADPLKKQLLNEMNNAEWEVLNQDEWDDGGEKMDEAVFIKTRAMDGTAYDDARSIMTTATNKLAGMEIAGEDARDKGKGKSGWTKVKSREKP